MSAANLGRLLHAYFTVRLAREREASPHTIASYRDTFRLLLQFVQEREGKAPNSLSLDDLDAPVIGRFLEHLERSRGNSARTRNARLAAIHAFFRYVALNEPDHVSLVQRVLAMPSKRHVRKSIEYLSQAECKALIAAPDRSTWAGRRDHAFLLLAVQSGLRVSEMTGLRCRDVALGVGAHVRCLGKGRKERCTPVRKETAAVLAAWLTERGGEPDERVFPNARGGRLSRDGAEYLVAKHVRSAAQRCATLAGKRVSPHVLRHSAAMDLLLHGVDHSVIALWLGHASSETTQVYLHSSLELKEKALAKTTPLGVAGRRYRPPDDLMAFLKSL